MFVTMAGDAVTCSGLRKKMSWPWNALEHKKQKKPVTTCFVAEADSLKTLSNSMLNEALYSNR